MDEVLSRESTLAEFLERSVGGGRGASGPTPHGPLPIILGITGHRDLREEDVPRLETILRGQFKVLKEKYPSTPFIVLTALADGADRLGARIALEAELRVIVPLPMPREIYESDFSDGSKIEFRNFLQRAEHSFELPLAEGATMENIQEHGIHRDRQYAQLGAYLARHSEILFAFWDGVTTQLPGGTAQIVRFKLEGTPAHYSIPTSDLDAPDSGPVFHIITPRRSKPETVGHQLRLHKIYPAGFEKHSEAEKAYADIYDRMDAFNKDAIRDASELTDRAKESANYLIPPKAQRTLPVVHGQLVHFYAMADVLSQHFQKRTLRTLRLLLSFVFLAAASYDLYSHVFEEWRGLIALYLTMFFLSYLCHRYAEKAGYQTKYLDYRAVAEGLRVQFFWKLAGLKDSVADYYMRKQKSELDWIRNAVRSTMTETYPEPGRTAHDTTPQKERLTQVLHHWVEDQAHYFAKAAHRDHERLHRNERIISILFALTLLLADIQLLLDANQYLIIGIGLLPVLAALMHTYLQKNALAEHSKQYDRMSVIYHRARHKLKLLIEEDRLIEAQKLILELGREALIENGDWILIHRERPLEVPKGA